MADPETPVGFAFGAVPGRYSRRTREVRIRYRFHALLFFTLVGIIELVDFASQVSMMADSDRMALAARTLDIGMDAVRTRLTLLVPLSAITASVALSVAYGVVVGDSRHEGRIICAALLIVHAAAFLVSGLVVHRRELSFGAAFVLLAALAVFFARTSTARAEPIAE